MSKNKKIQDKLAAKKGKIMNGGKKRLSISAAAVCCVFIAAFVIFIFARNGEKTEVTDVTETAQASAQETVFSYPVSFFEDGKVKYFKYENDNLTIRYFILKSSDSVIRAAFDACDVCWRAGKGYYQDGDEMVCRNCGRRFASIYINEVQGGCNPAPLKRLVKDGNVIIAADDIIKGKGYFDLSAGI